MESPSGPTGREYVLCRGLLLIVSLLTSWSLPTTAELSVVTITAAVGKDVVLHVFNKSNDTDAFIWYKGVGSDPNNYIAFITTDDGLTGRGRKISSRVSIDNEGSLLIKNVNLKDAGYYTIVAHKKSARREMRIGHLLVYEPVIFANYLVSNSTIKENEDAVFLTCYTNAVSIQWFFKGMNLMLTERMKLSNDQRTLIIDPVRKEDSGIYQCKASNPISSVKTWPIMLHVEFD